jgi:hypothetical protein
MARRCGDGPSAVERDYSNRPTVPFVVRYPEAISRFPFGPLQLSFVAVDVRCIHKDDAEGPHCRIGCHMRDGPLRECLLIAVEGLQHHGAQYQWLVATANPRLPWTRSQCKPRSQDHCCLRRSHRHLHDRGYTALHVAHGLQGGPVVG